jgi:sugar lactone lactonase YvrE
MAQELLDIGRRFRDAYAKSFAEGSKLFNQLAAPEGYLHAHIPAVSHKQDGEWITPASDYGAGSADVMSRINMTTAVNSVRQLGDDLLVLETTQSATGADGKEVSFSNVIFWTFENGRIVRQVQVASTAMWDAFRNALQAASAPGYAPGNEYWNDEKSNAARYQADKLSHTSAGTRTRVLAEGLAFTECPRWHAGRLWFSDILAGNVCVMDASGGNLETVVSLPAVTGVGDAWPTGLGWDAEDRLLVISMKDCRILRETTARSRQFVLLADLSSIFSHHCNDMVVDGAGRAYVGGYSFDVVKGEEPKPSELVLINPDGTFQVAADGLMMPNGMVLLGAGETLVVAESRANRLTAFDVDRRDGSLSNKRVWAELAGGPDGICADAEGCVWTSSPSTNEFLRVKEGGEVIDRVSTGENRAIACMLGGAERRTLFMCTNRPAPPEATTSEAVAAARCSLIEAAEVATPGGGLP